MAENQRTKAAGESLLFLGVLIAILVVANVFVAKFNFGRVDMTESGRFSLADGSERLAGNLEDRMEIVAYFSENLPPPFNSTEREVRDLLDEYAAVSRGNIEVTFINPDDEEKQEAADRDGVRRVAHQKVENDAVSVVEGYRGLVIKHLGETKVIPVIQDTSGLEYTITMAIKEMVGEKTRIGVLTGHEGPTLEKGVSILRRALPTYELSEVSADAEIDSALSALLIVGPESEFTDVELRRINQYVMNGGSLGIFGGGAKLSLEGGEPGVETVDTKINTLLSPWGVSLGSDLVADWQCDRLPMNGGPMGMRIAVPYPPIPIVTFDEAQREHPALFRINQIRTAFSSTIDLTSAPQGVNVTVLGRTTENSWRITQEGNIALRPRRPQEWQSLQTADSGPFPVIAAIEGTLPNAFNAASSSETPSDITAPNQSASEVRVLVFGTSSILRDEFLPQVPPGAEEQVVPLLAPALNAIDWLAAESDLIAIRAKNVEDPALEVPSAVTTATEAAIAASEQGDEGGVNEAIEQRKDALKAWEGKKRSYRWLNTLGIPVLFGIFGIIRWRMRLARKGTVKL